MEETEIVRRYRTADSKNKQIGILADLNDATRTEIKNILRKNGVEIKVEKKAKAFTAEVKEKSTEKCAECAEKCGSDCNGNCAGARKELIPGVVYSAVMKRMDVLDNEIKDRDMEYKALSDFLLKHESDVEDPIR